MRSLAWHPLAIGLFFATMGLAQVPPASTAPDRDLQAAESYFRSRQDDKAKSLLHQILAQSPDSYGANELMGLVLASEGEEEAANPFFVKAVRVQPNSADAHQNLGTNWLRLKKIDAAEREFKQAATLRPYDYITNHNLGDFYLQYGKFYEAAAYLKKAQDAQPDSYPNSYDLAVAEAQGGMLREAESQINALMKIRDTADLHALLAAVKEDEHDYLVAAQEYQRAAQMDPSEYNIFAWGAELLRHRTPDPAVQVLSRGLELYPRSPRLEISLGIALFMREFYDRAVAAFCQAIDLDPADPRPYYYLARTYAISPSHASDVTARLGQLMRLEPRNAQARYYYAMSMWKAARVEAPTADLPQVESLLRAAIDLDPSFAEAHLQLGALLAEEKRDSEALEHYEKAAKLDPNLADAHYRLGQALLKNGDTVRGEKELQISSQLHTHQLDEREKLTSEILRFVYTGPSSSPAPNTPH